MRKPLTWLRAALAAALVVGVVVAGGVAVSVGGATVPSVGTLCADETQAPTQIPVPPIRTTLGSMPGVGDLPARPELPDVLVASDGRKVTTAARWKKRREEMKRLLAYYAVGLMPPAPGRVTGQELASRPVLDGKVNYRLVHLSFGPRRGARFRRGDLHTCRDQGAAADRHLPLLPSDTWRGDAADAGPASGAGQGTRRVDHPAGRSDGASCRRG